MRLLPPRLSSTLLVKSFLNSNAGQIPRLSSPHHLPQRTANLLRGFAFDFSGGAEDVGWLDGGEFGEAVDVAAAGQGFHSPASNRTA